MYVFLPQKYISPCSLLLLTVYISIFVVLLKQISLCLHLFVCQVCRAGDKTLVVGRTGLLIRALNQHPSRCVRGKGGRHGLQLLILHPQNYLPECGWEGAKGESYRILLKALNLLPLLCFTVFSQLSTILSEKHVILTLTTVYLLHSKWITMRYGLLWQFYKHFKEAILFKTLLFFTS